MNPYITFCNFLKQEVEGIKFVHLAPKTQQISLLRVSNVALTYSCGVFVFLLLRSCTTVHILNHRMAFECTFHFRDDQIQIGAMFFRVQGHQLKIDLDIHFSFISEIPPLHRTGYPSSFICDCDYSPSVYF